MKKVLITGVAGFVGSSIAESLVRTNVQVVGVDRFSSYYDRRLKEANLARVRLSGDSLEFHEADINDVDLSTLLADVDTVFHEAGQPGVRPSWGSSFDGYVHDNVSATQRLLEACLEVKPPPQLIYASSSSIYGDSDHYPVSEEATPKPQSPYGVTKLAAEHLVSLYSRNFGLRGVSLRYFTVYGPAQRPDMAFHKMLRRAFMQEEIEVYGDGRQIRDFTYIDDVVRANLSAANANLPPGSVFNVAGGSAIELRRVVDIIESHVGNKLRLRYVAAVPGDVRRTGGSTDQISKHLSWEPQWTIEDGLASEADWVQQNLPLLADPR